MSPRDHHQLASHAVRIGTHPPATLEAINKLRQQYGTKEMSQAEYDAWADEYRQQTAESIFDEDTEDEVTEKIGFFSEEDDPTEIIEDTEALLAHTDILI